MALIQCPECEGKVSDKAKACIHCGYPLHSESPPVDSVCPDCGAQIGLGDSFCSHCGRSASGERGRPCQAPVPQRSRSVTEIALASNASSSTFARDASLRADELNLARRQYDAIAKCPKCGSTSLTGGKKGFGYGKAVAGAVIAGPIGILAGGIGANKAAVTCMKCGHSFTPQS